MEKRPDRGTERLIYGWLLLSVFSLVFAGIFALLVALARTPVIEDFLPLGRDYIYVALVGHVVLAVVIWFLAFEGFLWTLTSTAHLAQREWSRSLGWASLALAALGMGFIVVAAVFGLGTAELANYVPVLLTPVFYTGLFLFAAGILLNLINTFASVIIASKSGKKLPIITFGMMAAGIAVAIAFISFGLSGYFQLSTGKIFLDFERLFWGGGHILQFANTIAMTAAWIYLSSLVLKREAIGEGSSKLLYILYLLFVIPAPFIYFIYDTSAQAYKDSFTMLMQWGLGPSTAIFMLAIFSLIIKSERPWRNPGFSSLVLSMGVFMLGGLIALNISGVNTKIPAHYHCVIGAVTIAFMGLFYEIVPAFGRKVYSPRMATIQPYLYSLGIILFAVGLYLAGSHGVARKTYGSEQNLNNLGKLIGMSVMGIGGLVAISGGIIFVLNAMLTLFGSQKAHAVPLAEGHGRA